MSVLLFGAFILLNGVCTAAAIVDGDDSPEFFNFVYGQTEKDLSLFSLEDGYLLSELRLNMPAMDGLYRYLTEHGVPAREPRKWIEP